MTKGAGDTDMGATATQKKGTGGSKVQAPVAKVRTGLVILIVILMGAVKIIEMVLVILIGNAVATEIGILIGRVTVIGMVMVIVLQTL